MMSLLKNISFSSSTHNKKLFSFVFLISFQYKVGHFVCFSRNFHAPKCLFFFLLHFSSRTFYILRHFPVLKFFWEITNPCLYNNFKKIQIFFLAYFIIVIENFFFKCLESIGEVHRPNYQKFLSLLQHICNSHNTRNMMMSKRVMMMMIVCCSCPCDCFDRCCWCIHEFYSYVCLSMSVV